LKEYEFGARFGKGKSRFFRVPMMQQGGKAQKRRSELRGRRTGRRRKSSVNVHLAGNLIYIY